MVYTTLFGQGKNQSNPSSSAAPTQESAPVPSQAVSLSQSLTPSPTQTHSLLTSSITLSQRDGSIEEAKKKFQICRPQLSQRISVEQRPNDVSPPSIAASSVPLQSVMTNPYAYATPPPPPCANPFPAQTQQRSGPSDTKLQVAGNCMPHLSQRVTLAIPTTTVTGDCGSSRGAPQPSQPPTLAVTTVPVRRPKPEREPCDKRKREESEDVGSLTKLSRSEKQELMKLTRRNIEEPEDEGSLTKLSRSEKKELMKLTRRDLSLFLPQLVPVASVVQRLLPLNDDRSACAGSRGIAEDILVHRELLHLVEFLESNEQAINEARLKGSKANAEEAAILGLAALKVIEFVALFDNPYPKLSDFYAVSARQFSSDIKRTGDILKVATMEKWYRVLVSHSDD